MTDRTRHEIDLIDSANKDRSYQLKKLKLKSYRIYAHEEATWETTIEATSKEEAERLAYDEISSTGFDDWEVGHHGNTGIIEVEEIKE